MKTALHRSLRGDLGGAAVRTSLEFRETKPERKGAMGASNCEENSFQMSTDNGGWAPERETTVGTKLLQKARKSPLVPVGMVGFVAVAAYGLYRMKNRGNMKISVHLIHTRVAAQACVVGAITLGALYSMYKDHFMKPSPAGPQK